LVRTTSVLDCGGRCPLRMYVKDGVITRIETDDCENTDRQLRACWRGRAYRRWIYHPDRLKYPLKRVGEKAKMQKCDLCLERWAQGKKTICVEGCMPRLWTPAHSMN